MPRIHVDEAQVDPREVLRNAQQLSEALHIPLEELRTVTLPTDGGFAAFGFRDGEEAAAYAERYLGV